MGKMKCRSTHQRITNVWLGFILFDAIGVPKTFYLWGWAVNVGSLDSSSDVS